MAELMAGANGGANGGANCRDSGINVLVRLPGNPPKQFK